MRSKPQMRSNSNSYTNILLIVPSKFSRVSSSRDEVTTIRAAMLLRRHGVLTGSPASGYSDHQNDGDSYQSRQHGNQNDNQVVSCVWKRAFSTERIYICRQMQIYCFCFSYAFFFFVQATGPLTRYLKTGWSP